MRTLFLLAIFFLFVENSGFAQAGLLDSTFSTDGIAALFPGGYGNSVAIQDDGKIVVGGEGGTDGFVVVRFNDDGTLDSTFGVDGIAKTIVGLGSNQDEKIAIQADGKIVVSGTCLNSDGYWSCALLRYNASGTFDNTFSGDGKLIYSFRDPQLYGNAAAGVAIQQDGKIVTIGGSNELFETARFNSDGSFDNSFGTNGIVLTAVGYSYATASAGAIQCDGKIVVGGTSCAVPAPCSFAMVRYNSDGSLDNSFGQGGKDTTFFGEGGSSGSSFDVDDARTLVLTSECKILMTGVSLLGNDDFFTIPIARYNSDGSLDNQFGTGGKVRIPIPGYKYPYAFSIALQQDGKVVISGECADNDVSLNIMLLIRTLENGALDSSFGEGGIVFTSVDTSEETHNWLESVAIDVNQNIVATGQSYFGMTVLRYLSGLTLGIIDSSPVANEHLVYPNPIHDEATLTYAMQQEACLNVSLFDVQGRELQNLIHEIRMPGMHHETLKFDSSMPSGTYILSINDGISRHDVKIALIK